MINHISNILNPRDHEGISILQDLCLIPYVMLDNIIDLIKHFMINTHPLTMCNPPYLSILLAGTGGDRTNTFNISSISFLFLLSVRTLKIYKLSSTKYSSSVGSVDFFHSLPLNIHNRNVISNHLLKSNILFPHLARLRRAREYLALPTIFNIIFPFTNPIMTRHSLVGCSSLIAHEYILTINQYIISGLDGLDEFSIFSKTKISNTTQRNNYLVDYRINTKTSISVTIPSASLHIFINILDKRYYVHRKFIIMNMYIILRLSAHHTRNNLFIVKCFLHVYKRNLAH
ncbi:hypothetical protein [Candidatus Vidania fulgoroideorum]